MFLFFKQKTAYEMRISDWSSDVCSSDLHHGRAGTGMARISVGIAASHHPDPHGTLGAKGCTIPDFSASGQILYADDLGPQRHGRPQSECGGIGVGARRRPVQAEDRKSDV